MTDPNQPAKPARASRSRAALWGSLFGVVLTMLLIAAAAVMAHPQLRLWLLAETQARLDQLEQRQAAINARLDQLAAAPSAVTTAAVATDQPAGDVAGRIAGIESEIETLRRAMPPEGVILRLSERIEAAERAVRDIAQRQAAAGAALLVVGQLRDAVDRGDRFDLELAAAKRQLQADEIGLLDALVDGADSGIPRREVLLQRFHPLVQTLLQQEQDAQGGGFWHVIASHLHKLVTLRRMDGKGNDAEAVLGRVEAALAKEDWDQAVEEMHALPGPFAATAAPWIKQAELRLAADRALAKLAALVAARTAPP